MDLLRFIFIILMFFSIGCGVVGVKEKRKNIGFVILTVIVALSDLCSFFIIGANFVKDASNILLPYCILHAWSLFVFLVMAMLMDRKNRYIPAIVLSAICCIYQTYLVITQYFGARVFSFQKRIYFRKAFWVMVDSKNTGLFASYRSYRIALYINILIIIIVLLLRLKKSYTIFRQRYIVLLLISIGFSFVETIKIHYILPTWIPGMAYNFLPILCLYYTAAFARNRLRDWSLDNFANDMSDGLILYDRYNDLIHMNDMIRNTLSESIIEDFKDKDKLKEWVKSSRDEDFENVIVYKGIERDYYFKVFVKDLGSDDSHIGTLFILHDTTDSLARIKAVEKANEELERASRMKSDFLANMSHEIRTPMNAVIGMAEIAMREKDPQKITDYLIQIQSSGKNLLNIINDILDYSKIESGKMEIITEDYIPYEEYSDIANVVATRIGDKPLELFVILESELPHILHGDTMRIRQVLINLANNAVKFTKEGYVRINIKCEPASDGIVNISFHVVDTGIGIKEDDLQKLFVSFQQVDSKRNRSVEGTGLGLAISKRLVEAMGGTIGVDSEYGKGSDFWFSIPQKVVEDNNDIKVDNAAGKRAIAFDDVEEMVKLFNDEMGCLGVESSILHSLSDYLPIGKKDYLFFLEDKYDDNMRDFLDSHKDVNGIIIVDFDSEFEDTRSNLHIMRRPETTMGMVNVLNDRYDESRKVDEDKMFHADFKAPDAKVLIVDDNQINITIASDLIAPLKVCLDTADGGQAAINKVMSNEYDIVFMDHMMPEIDGVDATKTIRAAGDAIHQPIIIALSANVMEEAKKLFAEAGMNDFVAKPIDVRKFITTVKKWLPPEKIIENDGSEPEEVVTEEEVVVKLDELDIDTAVRALGSASVYNKIAGEYYRSGEDRLNSIKEAFAKDDWADYTIKVHALKSSSRQIGAMELGAMAEALEKAGKAGNIDIIKADNDKALSTFKDLLDKLSEFYESEEEDDTDKPLIDNATLLKLMDELETFCDDLDMDGMEGIDSKLKEFSYEENLGADIEALHGAISDIDVDECMEIIGRLRLASDK